MTVTCHWTPWPMCKSLVINTSELSTCLTGRVLVTGSKVWVIVKMPWEERQCCIVGAGMVVQRWCLQFNVDGFLDSALKPSVFSVQNVDITVLRVSLFLQMLVHCWVWTWRDGSPMLCHVLVELSFDLFYRGLHPLHCTAYTIPLILCLGVLYPYTLYISSLTKN